MYLQGDMQAMSETDPRLDAVKSAACLVSVPEVQSLIHHFEAVLGTLPRACAPIPECKESHKLLR